MDLAQSLLLSGCKIECGKQAYTQLLPTVLEIGGGTARNILEFQKNFKSVQLLITWLLQFHAIHLPSDNSEPGTVHTCHLFTRIWKLRERGKHTSSEVTLHDEPPVRGHSAGLRTISHMARKKYLTGLNKTKTYPSWHPFKNNSLPPSEKMNQLGQQTLLFQPRDVC